MNIWNLCFPVFYGLCADNFSGAGDIYRYTNVGFFTAAIQYVFDEWIIPIGGFDKYLRAVSLL